LIIIGHLKAATKVRNYMTEELYITVGDIVVIRTLHEARLKILKSNRNLIPKRPNVCTADQPVVVSVT
jgi:hypothetical protein